MTDRRRDGTDVPTLVSGEATHAERRSDPAFERKLDFGPRYRVIGTLGRGGMGEVYQAHDKELGEDVAIKVIRADLDDSDGALARFRREIALARKVSSPHVLRVHDLAEHDSCRFLSMQFVDGGTLAELIKREQKLPLARTMHLFHQICAGVAAAHDKGVMHRDLKPQNVLVDREDNVFVADFGLARSIGDSGLTASGAVLGSPGYMSPEQVRGDEVDERTDVYSLGVMLYQLVTGEMPFQGTSPHAVMEMRLHKPPRPLREIDSSVPRYVEAIALKCMELDPTRRYRSVASVVIDLENGRTNPDAPLRSSSLRLPSKKRSRVGVAVALAGLTLALASGAWWYAQRHTDEGPTVAPPSPLVAVAKPPAPPPVTNPQRLIPALLFPFENATPDPSLEAADLVMQFAFYHSRLVDPIGGVVLRHLAASLSPEAPLDDEIGRKLAARDNKRVIAIHGTSTVRGKGYAFTINVRDLQTNEIILTKMREASSSADAVAALTELTVDVRRLLGETVPEGPHTSGISPLIEADHAFSTAMGAYTVGNDVAAYEHVRRAIKLDPEFTLAQELLGLMLVFDGKSNEADVHFRIALRFMDRLSERNRFRVLGDYYQLVTEEYARSIEQYESLLAIWPDDYVAGGNLPTAYAANNEPEKALAAAKRFALYNTGDSVTASNLPSYLLVANRYEEALKEARASLATAAKPNRAIFEYLTYAAYLVGNRDEAITAATDVGKVSPSASAGLLADIALTEGRLDDAHAILLTGLKQNEKERQTDQIEQRYLAIAELELLRGNRKAALSAARHAMTTPVRQYLASVVRIQAGDEKGARKVAETLDKATSPTGRAFGKLLHAELARADKKPANAIALADASLAITNRWFGHFVLARTYLDKGDYALAYSELQICLARRGEIVSSEMSPSLHYVPTLTYYLAKAQQGLKSPDAAATYKKFLSMMPTPDAKHVLATDAKRFAK